MTQEALFKIAQTGADRYFEEQMEILKQFSGIDCPTKCEGGNRQVVEILKKTMAKMDVAVEEYYRPGFGTHLVARIRPEKPNGKIIISAHLDTQTGFKLGDTAKYPYHIEGNWAYGIGICDCKAGVVSSLYSVRIMQEAGLLPNKEIVMIYSCDEEVGSPSSRDIFKKEAADAEMAFVFEPTRDDNGLIVERKGIGIAQLKVIGRAAHPTVGFDQGRSAAKELTMQAVRIFNSTIEGEILYDVSRLYSNHGISSEATARVTAALLSERSTDLFYQLMKEINEGKPFVDGCTCEAEIQTVMPMMPDNPGTRKIYELVKRAGRIMEMDYPEQHSNGCGDACLYTSFGCPSLDGMGPYMKDIHTYNERLYIPSLKERTMLFALTLGIMDGEK